MQILIVPDKFKGSLSAFEVCDAIENGLLRHHKSLRIKKIPMADGGEGSLDIVQKYLNLRKVSLQVTDPLGRGITADYSISQDRAYIEMARASGLDLLKRDERNCLYTNTYGTGQLILDAHNRGIKKVFLFVGGSATNDGGIGVLEALGIFPLGTEGRVPSIGKSLPLITGFEESEKRVRDMEFSIICDVRNPLYGPDGAAFVYAPQKGADATAVELLDRGLQNLAKVAWETKNVRIDDFEGAGAAGGIAAGLKAFYTVSVVPGFDTISEMVGLYKHLSTADLVITGEGKFDLQTLQGKVIKGVYDLCVKSGKQLAVICGVLELDPKTVNSLGFWKIKPLVRDDTTMGQAQANAFNLVSQRAFELLQEYSW